MYILPDELRSALQTPVGKLIQTAGLREAVRGADPLIGVGDVTCLTLLDEGFRPRLIMVDFKNERQVMASDDPRRKTLESFGDTCLKVDNPPATITDELIDAIMEALEGEGTYRIEVDGEEDLAVLPCMVHAGNKAKIVYGMPGQGMVVVDNDIRMATWAQAFMTRMVEG